MIEIKFNISQGDFTLDVNLTLPARGITALFGPSGSGKTTLLRAIAGLEKHPQGLLKINQTTWQSDNFFLPPHQRSVGYVFQEASLFNHLSVQANLEYGLKRIAVPDRKVSLQQAIDLLGIGHLLKRKPALLSGGERQRVAIARAVAVSPKILLMDEPLASLDQPRKDEILPYIASLGSALDIPVVYVSHSSDEISRLADHLVLLEAGKVLGIGPISEMLTRTDLSLSRRNDAEALIETRVSGYDDEYELSYLEFSGGHFSVLGRDLKPGTKVRLRVAAQDVSLTLESQSNTSILNIFPARVIELIDKNSAQITVNLLIGDIFILARVTRKSATLLDLQPGKEVFAQIKSVAVLG